MKSSFNSQRKITSTNNKTVTHMQNLQKDLSIIRMKGYNNQKYQYQLFRDGKSSKLVLTDIMYHFGVVSIHPIDNSVSLQLKEKAGDVTCKELHDEEVFIVPVTIKSH